MQPEPCVNTVNVLIVDDQPENLVALQAVLSDLNLNVVQANNAREALRHVLEQEFAVILLDVNMPGTNGFELAELIRGRESSKYTPIIFLTAMYTEDADISTAYSIGAVDFMMKPFVPEVLRGKVIVFAELYRKSQEIKRQAEVIAEIEKQRNQEEKDRLQAEQERIREELLRKEAEKKLLEEHSSQLQKADKLKTEFLANMSHEIRTPMNGVIGMAELLLQTPLTGEQKEFARIIRESAQALLIIINDILDLSKIEAGRLELEAIDFNLNGLVEGTTELLVESAREKQLNVMTYVDPALPSYFTGDPGRLRQVLMNLIGNALKFTDQGEVVIRVVPDGTADDTAKRRLKFSISDTGIGLSTEAMDRLFRPFSQADGSTTRKFGGTGLGLSISKRLAELMGGEIGVESKLKEGSTFWFSVPLRVGSDDSGERIITHIAASARVLVVDPFESTRSIVQTYLRSWGMRCETVATATDAMDELLCAVRIEEPYDILITDLAMPDLDGRRLLSNIRKQSSLGKLRTILCTATDAKEQMVRARDMGFDAFVSKPVQQARLLQCISNLMKLPASIIGALTPEPDHSVAAKSRKKRVLLAEDNLVNQKVATLQLKQLGMSCFVVANGKEAVQQALENSYDMILMDCQMPEMDGFEATKAIREAESLLGRHTPIIGLTAHAMEGDRERCIRSGMDDYLSKPTSLDRLSLVINRWKRQSGIEEADDTAVDTKADFSDFPDLTADVSTELLAELLPVYLITTESSITAMIANLADGRFKEVEAIAHEIETTSLSVGAKRLAAVCADLAVKAQKQNFERLDDPLRELKRSFERLKTAAQPNP